MNSAQAPVAAMVKIEFTGYWLSSTGSSGKGDLDIVCYRDSDGCPALPMTQVKGMLRETAKRVWPAAEVDDFFGERDVAGQPKAGALRFAGEAGLEAGERAFFAANFKARAALFGRLRSTRIDAQGVADDQTLRTAEVAVPLTITGRVDWNADGREPDSDWVERLNSLCRLTFAFGHGKMDGLGRALASALPLNITAPPPVTGEGRILTIDLTPDDPAVFSRLNANEGRQSTLAGPNGAALWGWAISRLRADLDERGGGQVGQDALRALLAGKVSFSDAAPLGDDGRPAFTRPAVLFAPKQPVKDADRPFAGEIYNPAALTIGMAAFAKRHRDTAQPEVLSAVPLTTALDAAARPGRAHRLRSAHRDGKAEHGKLFGYQHVERAPRGYRARIEGDESIDDATWTRITDVFARRLFLGKARNNGYGGSYKVVDAASEWLAPSILRPDADEARIWCLTDLALYDRWGQIKTAPGAGEFGLPADWRLVPTESAVTTRRFAPWDTSLGGHEREVVLIEAGSVFAFAGSAVGDELTLPTRIGDMGERGCGLITLLPAVMPEMSAETHRARAKREAGTSALTRWATMRATARDTSAADEWARAAIAAMSDAGGFAATVRDGPTKSQWSALRRSTDVAELPDRHGWNVYGRDGERWITLKEWLGGQLNDLNRSNIDARAKESAVKRVVDHARRLAPQGKGRER